MKYVITIAMLLGFAAPVQASYLEACDFAATVVRTSAVPTLNDTVDGYTPLVTIHIDSAADQGSHVRTACTHRVDTEQTLLLKEGESYTVGQSLVINFFHVNSMSPTGVMMSESWSVLDGAEGALLYDCFQTDRSLPLYTVQLRASTDPHGPTDSTNVYVYRDGELIVAETDVHMDYIPSSPDGDDRWERELIRDSFTLKLAADQDLGHATVASGLLELTDGDVSKIVQCAKR